MRPTGRREFANPESSANQESAFRSNLSEKEGKKKRRKKDTLLI